jgi:isoleucyl-tRNA synthetase
MFKAVSTDVKFPELEQRVLEFWDRERIYEASLAQRAGAPAFVFFEGPPTANGLPHPGHCLTRAIKDLFPRYRTMRGYRCERKAGWDTHGLPVEVEVGKELGIHRKEEIEAYGIEPFIQRCQQSVWKYMQDWEQLTRRLGFWVDLKSAYVTYHQSYIESVWWSLKELFERGLLFRGHKIVWWWAQGGTALSSGEVGQGYREVADPSVYVRFPLVDEPNASLLVWTTTPWTLPSNMFAAVHPHLRYARVLDSETGQRLYIAEDLVETIAAKIKRPLTVEATCLGTDLIGRRYQPPFDYYHRSLADKQGELRTGQSEAWYFRVVPAEFVTTDSGTGLVHQAPAYGEVDYEVLVEQQARFAEGQGPVLFHAVGPDGRFTSEAPDLHGQWVKDADKLITRQLKEAGLLLHQEQYLHEYPFCWRAEEDPLIQYPRESWFIRTTAFRDLMLANNRQINWLPPHIRDGRFGNFLESNVDWALSRERYWGTPLPIWVCETTGRMEAIGSYAELLSKPGVTGTDVWQAAKQQRPELVDDLRVHKPYIDAVEYDSPFAPGSRMRRVPDVIDCWYDSGAMPFAQWGWPHQNAEALQQQFPADFISEAIDQTRGWFYSQLAISTILFGPQPQDTPATSLPPAAPQPTFPQPFRNCIVLGLMLGEDGNKMSKSKRNYREPREIFDRYGADALRWFFFASQPPWTTIRYREQAIRDSIPEFLLRLWNVFSFFTIYAEIDGFDPTRTARGERLAPGQLGPSALTAGAGYRDPAERAEIDRWILSELHRTIEIVVERMDAYDNYSAGQAINELVDAVSNWYVRRSRDRFWAADKQDPDKLDAYWTLYETLLEISKLIAPFVPFLAETLWQQLARQPFADAVPRSVHLCDYPSALPDRIDRSLSTRMQLLREIASLGRAARATAKLKVRIPLPRVEVVLAQPEHQPWLATHEGLVRDELNVKQIEFATDAREYVNYSIQPNFKRLGPRVGKLLPALKSALQAADGGSLLEQLQANGQIQLTVDGQEVELDGEDVQVRLQARDGWTAAQGRGVVVVLATDVTPELQREGLAKDLVRQIQQRRKELQCRFTDRIRIGLTTADASLQEAVAAHRQEIMEETLASSLILDRLPNAPGVELADLAAELFIAIEN